MRMGTSTVIWAVKDAKVISKSLVSVVENLMCLEAQGWQLLHDAQARVEQMLEAAAPFGWYV